MEAAAQRFKFCENLTYTMPCPSSQNKNKFVTSSNKKGRQCQFVLQHIAAPQNFTRRPSKQDIATWERNAKEALQEK